MFGWWRTHNIDDSEEDDATDEQSKHKTEVMFLFTERLIRSY